VRWADPAVGREVLAACGKRRCTDARRLQLSTHPGPALVELVTDPNALSVPPHITGEQVRGFALAASKTVLAGGVGQMLKMARANIRNIPRPAAVR